MKIHSKLNFLAIVVALGALSAPGGAFAKEGKEWSYSAPEKWGDIDQGFALCSGGRAQSPIDIISGEALEATMSEVVLHWAPFIPEVINNGHTIQVNAKGEGGYATLGGKSYRLLQYHFHHGSEHRLDGQQSPMEVHFVHQSDEGDLLVVGVFIKEGRRNNALDGLWPLVPEEGGKASGRETVDPSYLTPATSDSYRYKGSLTTPPCSEIVTWHVMSKPVEASRMQIGGFASLYPDNARPVQPLERRYVLKSNK